MDPSRLTMALWGDAGYAPENDAISFARQKDKEAARADLVNALAGTWPVQMAKSAVGAAALPGDVYAGRVDPQSEVGIQRAADLAGFVMGGSFAAPRPAGSIGMGGMPEKPSIRAYHGSKSDFQKFDLSKAGSETDPGALGRAIYASDDPRVMDGRPHKYEVQLNIQNPLELQLPTISTRKVDVVSEALGLERPTRETFPEWARSVGDAVKTKGHDSIVLDYSPSGYKAKEYAVFDDALIEILRKYGLTGLLGLGAVGGAYQSQTQEGGT